MMKRKTPDNVTEIDLQIAVLRKAKGRLTFYKILNWSSREDFRHLKNVQSACVFQILVIIILFSNLTRNENPADSPMLTASPLLILWLIAVSIILVRSRKLLALFEEHSPRSIDELIEKIREKTQSETLPPPPLFLES